nr:ABC transporter G family member 22 isoform X4 [Ipomoea batatas]
MENWRVLNPIVIEENNVEQVGATWCEQFSVLLRRGFKERRHEYFSTLRITQVIITALIAGLLWWPSDVQSPNRVADQATIFTFPQERAMLVKERSVNMYKLSAYLVARSISDIPLDLFLPVIFLTIVYFMIRSECTDILKMSQGLRIGYRRGFHGRQKGYNLCLNCYHGKHVVWGLLHPRSEGIHGLASLHFY